MGKAWRRFPEVFFRLSSQRDESSRFCDRKAQGLYQPERFDEPHNDTRELELMSACGQSSLIKLERIERVHAVEGVQLLKWSPRRIMTQV